MFRVEVGRAMRRTRTWMLGGLAVAVALLPVIILASSPAASGGPPFFEDIRRNGLLDPLPALFLIQPFFLPLAVGLLAGDSVAGEASAGMLRYLLIRPVRRSRLVLAKYAGVVALTAAGIGVLLVVGFGAGAIAFGIHPMPTLSGTELAVGPGVLRILATGLYVLAGAAGLGAIGIFVSTLTESGPGATVATVALVIISEILDALSQLHRIHPYLLTHDWMAWPNLFRSPIAWGEIEHGLIVDGVYALVFLAGALFVLGRKDVTS